MLRDGVIACIGAECATSAAALEIDATGLAILPGFIDLHRHFFGGREDPGIVTMIWNTARMMPGKRRELLEAGITSIRQLGDPRDAILEVKRRLEARELAGSTTVRRRADLHGAGRPPGVRRPRSEPERHRRRY